MYNNDLDLLKVVVNRDTDLAPEYTSGDVTVGKLLDLLYNLRPDSSVSWQHLYNLIKEEYADPEGIWGE